MPTREKPEKDIEKDAPDKDKAGKATLSVTASSLNVRSGPSSSSKIVGSVTRGMQLQQVGEEGSWINAAYSGGKEGWVYSKYVKKEKASDEKDAAKPPVKDKPDEIKDGERAGLDLEAALAYNKARGLTRAQWRTIQKAAGTKADGVLGPNTVKAIYDFQVSKGLKKADGKAGPSTQKTAGVKADSGGRDPKAEEKDADKEGKEDIPSGNISAHFSWQDFVSANNPKPVPKRYRKNVIALTKELEKLRVILGRSIRMTPNGGYREKRGAPKSQHKVGKAADIQVPGLSSANVRKAIRRAVKNKKMRPGGIGGYPSFSHYDISRPRTWGSW